MNIARQAIVTKYLPATNTKGARIKAICDAGSLTVPFPHKFSGAEAHEAVARQLMEKLGWKEKMYCGAAPDKMDWSYVFVLI